MQHNRYGFTVIELVIVAIIISIIITVVVPAYTQAVEQSRCSSAMKTLALLRSAQFDYLAENQTFTTTMNQLQTYVGLRANLNSSEWTYAVAATPAGNPPTFTVAATRLRGSHINQYITLDQDETWSGNYPINGPW